MMRQEFEVTLRDSHKKQKSKGKKDARGGELEQLGEAKKEKYKEEDPASHLCHPESSAAQGPLEISGEFSQGLELTAIKPSCQAGIRLVVFKDDPLLQRLKCVQFAFLLRNRWGEVGDFHILAIRLQAADRTWRSRHSLMDLNAPVRMDWRVMWESGLTWLGVLGSIIHINNFSHSGKNLGQESQICKMSS